MLRKKSKFNESEYEFEQVIWKENGIEQKTLEEMFSSGKITDHDTPKEIRNSEPIFQKFTPQVFNAHFRKTKNRLGMILFYF